MGLNRALYGRGGVACVCFIWERGRGLRGLMMNGWGLNETFKIYHFLMNESIINS